MALRTYAYAGHGGTVEPCKSCQPSPTYPRGLRVDQRVEHKSAAARPSPAECTQPPSPPPATQRPSATPPPRATDQKAGGSSPSGRAQVSGPSVAWRQPSGRLSLRSSPLLARGRVVSDPGGPCPDWMRRVGMMRRMRMRLVRMVVRPGRRGGRCRARAGRGSGPRGARCRRSGRGRCGRTGRASRGRAGMPARGAPATSRGGSWPGRGYLSMAWPGEVAVRSLPVIAGSRSRASERGGASTPITGELYPCDGLTERDGPCHHDGRGNGDRQGGP
jgi:hypothetical protein